MNDRTKKRKNPGLQISLITLFLCLGQTLCHSAGRDSLIRFMDGSMLHGELQQVSLQQGIRWAHTDLANPVDFRPDNFSAERFLGLKLCRPKKMSAEKFLTEIFFGRIVFRPKKNSAKNFSAENFAVRIAEGGSNGWGPGWRRPPPVRPRKVLCEKSIRNRRYLLLFDFSGRCQSMNLLCCGRISLHAVHGRKYCHQIQNKCFGRRIGDNYGH